MPRSIQTHRPRVPNTSQTPSPVAPGESRRPSSSNPPASNGWDRPIATAPLAKPIPLGQFEGQPLSISPQGRLVLPDDGGKLEDTLAAHRAALKGAQGTNPFAALADKAALQAVVQRLAVLHEAGMADPVGDKQTLDLRQLRATSLALIELAAIRAGELGDAPLQTSMLETLVAAVRGEPYRPLKDFVWESLVARADEQTLPLITEAQEAVYPSKPPTEKMLEDGKLTVAYYIDNEGSKKSYQLSYLRSFGFKATKLDDHNYLFTREASPGQPAVEIRFKSPPEHGDKPKLFEAIDDPEVDIIAYTGHAGYGHRVESAINQGATGTGEGKLVVLMQCNGSSNIEAVERAFPDAHLVSTTAPSADQHDQMMFRQLLRGVLERADYQAVGAKVTKKLRTAWYLEGANPETHFFYPCSRQVIRERLNRDRDGVSDLTDRVFNVVYPKRLDAAGGFDPVVQLIDDDALDGHQAASAIRALSDVMRYNALLEDGAAQKVKWGAELLQLDGFYPPAGDDLRAFAFQRDPQGDRLLVKLSTRFAHSSASDLSRMLAYEVGLFLGEEAGLDAPSRAALALTMLERVVHQDGDWRYSSSLLEEPWAEESLLAQRYGFDGPILEEIGHATEHADEMTTGHVAQVKALVEARPPLTAAVARAPTRVGEPLTVPNHLRLAARDLDLAALQRIVDALGIQAEAVSFGPSYISAGEPNNLVVVVREQDGRTQQLGLSLDNEGVLCAASRLSLDVDLIKARAGRAYLAEVAEAWGREVQPLHQGYAEALERGLAPAEAVAAVLQTERKNLPLGTALPELKAFERLRRYGLTTGAENSALLETMARLYPKGEALAAEKAVVAWLERVAEPTRVAELKAAYLDALVAAGSREGAGQALVEVFERLGQRLDHTFPLKEVMESDLVTPAALPTMLKAFQAQAQLSDLELAKALALVWFPDLSGNGVMQVFIEELATRTSSAAELLNQALAALDPSDYFTPNIDTALLEKLGLLSPTEATALFERLAFRRY